MRAALAELWPRIEETSSRLTLLNGVWSQAPSLRPGILRLACQRHVVVADRPPRAPGRLAGNAVTQAVVVTAETADKLRLSVQCRRPGGSLT